MDRSSWLLAFTLLSLATASAQHFASQVSVKSSDVSCQSVESQNGPFRCPNGSSCGTYVTLSTETCNIEYPVCNILAPVSYCCGRFPIDAPSDPCAFTKMRDPLVRSRILELAEENDILIPTCSGAYVPARIAFREHKEKDNGGL
jgi:hypothetical protein